MLIQTDPSNNHDSTHDIEMQSLPDTRAAEERAPSPSSSATPPTTPRGVKDLPDTEAVEYRAGSPSNSATPSTTPRDVEAQPEMKVWTEDVDMTCGGCASGCLGFIGALLVGVVCIGALLLLLYFFWWILMGSLHDVCGLTVPMFSKGKFQWVGHPEV